MTSNTSPGLIAIDDLCVGMYVHLDMGWWAHPFPLGNFKITNAEQIATMRSLGLLSVRWSPSESDLPGAPVPDAADLPGPHRAHSGAGAGMQQPTPAESPALRAQARHRRVLASQRAALDLCERQFGEAAINCRHVCSLVQNRPHEARVQAEQLSRALVGKMLGTHDLCIRLLGEAAGDKASMHAINVAVLSLLMGRAFGLPEVDMLDLGVGAMLHDIGKLDLPDRVRHQDDNLSAPELLHYEEHVAHGVVHGRRMGLSNGALLVIAQHHEQADGSGFPLRLGVDDLPLASRIVALVNRYDDLCNPDLASKALTPHHALALLFAQGRDKFDASILGAFIRMMGVYPAGSTVQLTDDRYALVVDVNSSRPLKPRVLVHESGVPREEALLLDLEASVGIGIRRSLRREQLPDASLAYLAPHPRVSYFFEAVELAHDASAA